MDSGFERGNPVLYPSDRVQSPITSDMVGYWTQQTASNGGLPDDVFAKTGDSKFVSSNSIGCFAGGNVDLGANTHLEGTLNYFLAGDAAGSTPFDRSSLAVRVGRTATWLVGGNPSPLEQEFAAVSPRFTLIAFGKNDMAFPDVAQFPNKLWDAVDYTLANGSIPVIYSTVPCQSCPGGIENVDLYRRLARAVAQYHQIPFVDLYQALNSLPGQGLGADGVNMNVYSPDGSAPCVLTTAGLQFGYNNFNLITLEVLDRLRSTLLLGMSAPDPNADRRDGAGSLIQPVIVGDFPYSAGEDLRRVVHDDIVSYSGCPEDGATQGPEMIFEIQVDATATLVADLISRDGSDLDLWLFENDLDGMNCTAFANQTMEETVEQGTWYLVVEAFNDKGTLQSGQFVLSVDLQ